MVVIMPEIKAKTVLRKEDFAVNLVLYVFTMNCTIYFVY